MKTTPFMGARRSGPRFFKLLRLGAYCAVMGLFSGGLALNAAYGGVKDAALELGGELGKLASVGSKRPILLNGEPIFVTSVVDDVPVHELLDRVEARCEGDPAGLAEALPSLPAPERAALKERVGKTRGAAGIVRRDQRDRGMVACFMRPAADAASARVPAFARFLETGDLGELGELRYVYAEKTDTGSTHVVTAWTQGSFNLFSLLATDRDAPGADLPGVPRPAGAVRILSASVEGAPYGVRIYRAPGAPEPVLERYDAEMKAHGFERLIDDGTPRRVYARAGGHVFVVPEVEGDSTVLTMVQMGGV